jgi:hypothetical protein
LAEYHDSRCGDGIHGKYLPLRPKTPFFINPQSHGYATEEFEVTRERLGVYLPVSVQTAFPLSSESFEYDRFNTSITQRDTETERILEKSIRGYDRYAS